MDTKDDIHKFTPLASFPNRDTAETMRDRLEGLDIEVRLLSDYGFKCMAVRTEQIQEAKAMLLHLGLDETSFV